MNAIAERYGVSLSVGHVLPGWGFLRASDVKASLRGVPVTVSASSMDVEMSLSLAPTAVVLEDAEIAIDGSTPLSVAIDRWRAQHPTTSDGVGRIGFRASHVVWSTPSSPARVEIGGLDGTIDRDSAGDRYRFVAPELTVRAGERPLLGPWSIDADGAPAAQHLRVLLVPSLPSGPNASLARSSDGREQIDVSVASTSLDKLGLPVLVTAFGNIPFELTAHAEGKESTEIDGKFSAALSGARLGQPALVGTLRASGSFSLPATGLATLHNATFGFGPFAGSIAGTFGLDDTKTPHAKLTFGSAPVPCSEVARVFAAQAFGAVGKGLGALAEASGLTKAISGHATVRGGLEIDGAAVPPVRFTLAPDVTCGLLGQ